MDRQLRKFDDWLSDDPTLGGSEMVLKMRFHEMNRRAGKLANRLGKDWSHLPADKKGFFNAHIDGLMRDYATLSAMARDVHRSHSAFGSADSMFIDFGVDEPQDREDF